MIMRRHRPAGSERARRSPATFVLPRPEIVHDACATLAADYAGIDALQDMPGEPWVYASSFWQSLRGGLQIGYPEHHVMQSSIEAVHNMEDEAEYMYRFRSMERLLGDSAELEKQEIYFASADQLNDPLEGRKNIFWQGDHVVWENLLRHYICCLMVAYTLTRIKNEDDPPTWNDIPVQDPYGEKIPTLKKFQNQIFEAFFSNEGVKSYIRSISDGKHRIWQPELITHLNSVNQIALLLIDFFARTARGTENSPPNFKENIDSATRHLLTAATIASKIAGIQSHDERYVEAAYMANLNSINQLNFISRYNGDINPREKGKIFLAFDFPIGYVHQLEALMYPPWFAACFMRNSNDSAMWGYYGDSHTGVCLKFRAKRRGERLVLGLRTLVGESSSGRLYNRVEHEFRRVTYDLPHVEVNFFKTLGKLPIPVLNRHWYTDSSGNRSKDFPNGARMAEDDRRAYWESFTASATTKIKSWASEGEYRLVLHSNLFQLGHDDRKLRYDFADLDGIIFGINTSVESKLKIAKIVEQKCRAHGRTDFKFFQTYFSRHTGEILNAPMSLLKFS